MKNLINQLLLLVAALFVPTLLGVYRWLVVAALPLTLLAMGALLWWASQQLAGLGVLLLLAVFSAWRLARSAHQLPRDPFDGERLDKALAQRFIAWIGTLKYFSSPLCVIEDPGSYRIRGDDIRTLIADGFLQPGDILLRGYQGYVDGELIRMTGGAQGAANHFSHAALYLGTTDDTHDRPRVAGRLQQRTADSWRSASEADKEKFRADPGYFQAGPGRVAHSMTKGVHLEDVLTFLRCDFLAVLRLPETIQVTEPGILEELQPVFRQEFGELGAAFSLDARLNQGETLERPEIIREARATALECVGIGYDFLFEDRHTYYCSEFVHFCFAGVSRHLGLYLTRHSFAGLFARQTITPPDIYKAAEAGKLQLVWTNVR